ncbi:MAG: response regulator transcription factor [Pseudomonadota bacterium]
MRILIVEDDARVADFLQRALKSEGYQTVRTENGKSALELVGSGDFDLILLDLMLPGLSGLEVCQALRMRRVDLPIIMLTALDTGADIVRGLRMGADDYMTKPFDLDELLARIDAVGRRLQKGTSESQLLRAGDVVFDLYAVSVTRNGDPVELTAKELAVLELLMRDPDRLFSRERILNNIWGIDMDPMTNVVDVYISKLRKKLSSEDGTAFIETVRGLGYRINPSLTTSEAPAG